MVAYEQLEDPGHKRKIGVLGVVFIGYFWVSGGMYGTESLMATAPPAYIFLCLILCPLLYALPAALMCVDLATAYPVDGGMVSWIDIAFGGAIGVHNTYWNWASYMFNAAVYPIMAAGYVIYSANMSEDWTDILVLSIIVVITIVRLFNLDFLVRFSTVLTLMSVLPAIVYIGYMFKYIDPSTWTSVHGHWACNDTNSSVDPEIIEETCDAVEVQWVYLLPYVMWLWSGFFALGTLAGEVKNPARTFPIATLLLIPLVFIEYTVPLALTLSYDHDQYDFEEGYFSYVARDVAGRWLDVILTIAAIVCLVGGANASTIVCDEAMQSFFMRHNPEFFERTQRSRSIKRWFFDTENRAAPAFVLFNSLVMVCIIWFPFQFLIAASSLIFNVSTTLLSMAYILLKIRNPDGGWLYPGHWAWSLLLTLPPLAVSLTLFYFSLTEYSEEAGVPYINIVMLSFIIGSGLIAHVVVLVKRRYFPRALHFHGHKPLDMAKKDPSEHVIDETTYLKPSLTNESYA